jgi:hypothetical protein
MTEKADYETDARRWRAVRKLLVGADFRWGEPPMPVVCFELPNGIRIGASADDFADQLLENGFGDDSGLPSLEEVRGVLRYDPA